MNEKDIVENNILIAKFLGWKLTPRKFRGLIEEGWDVPLSDSLYDKAHSVITNAIYFHTSFDWLMPVVEKIKQLGFFYKITEWQTLFYKYSDYSGVVSYASKTDIDEPEIYRTWLAVVEFIRFYNSQTKPTNT